MAKPRLFFITLEDLNEVAGQTVRYLRLLPHLARHVDLVWVGRRGEVPPPFRPFFRDRVALPYPAGVRPMEFIVHPAGPWRLARLARALARLPSDGETILFADSILLAQMAAPSPHRRLVAEVDGVLCEEFRNKRRFGSRLLYPFLKRWERRAFRAPDAIAAIGPGVEAYIRSISPADHGKVEVLGNGIDPEVFHPGVDGSAIRRAQGWGDAPVGVLVSSFRPWHGAANLVRMLPHVLSQRPDFRLVLVGDGPEKPATERLVRTMNLCASVHFTGPVPTNPDEVPLWLAAADLGLYYPQFEPGRFTFWGSPIKFLELIAMGKPVVTLRLPHWAHEVERADAGVFTDATPEAFAQGVLELVSDPARMREMGRRGAAAAARQHTWQAVARGILTQCGVPIDD